MVKAIVRDPIFLARRSAEATTDDIQTADDLLDTLIANSDSCVGMAANMIGVSRRIIAFADGDSYTVVFNPTIVKRSDPFDTEEGCLSLDGVRKTKRWRSVKVSYQTRSMQRRFKTYVGWTAQIIQHEIDHCDGILI